MKILDSSPWDVVVLDHDLGPGDDVRGVVAALEAKAATGKQVTIAEVVIVTRNSYGAAWIEAGLCRHYPLRRIPLAGATVAI